MRTLSRSGSSSLQFIAALGFFLFASLFRSGETHAQTDGASDQDSIFAEDTIDDIDRQLDEGERSSDLWEEYQEFGRDRESGPFHTEDGERIYRSGEERVHIGGNVTVREHEWISADAVAVGGSVDVYGRVDGDVVAIGGSVRLHDGAQVRGDCVAIGGQVREMGDVDIRGEKVSVGLNLDFLSGAFGPSFERQVRFGRVFFDFGSVLIWLVVAFFAYALAGNRLEVVSRRVDTEPGQSFLVGLIAAFGTPLGLVLAIVILAITIIGILLIPVLLLVLLFAAGAAFASVALAVGRRFAHRRGSEELPQSRSDYYYLLIGTLALSALTLVAALLRLIPFMSPLSAMLGVLGVFVTTFATILGFGALLTSRLGSTPAPDRVPSFASIPPPPPPVPPVESPSETPPPPPPAAESPEENEGDEPRDPDPPDPPKAPPSS